MSPLIGWPLTSPPPSTGPWTSLPLILDDSCSFSFILLSLQIFVPRQKFEPVVRQPAYIALQDHSTPSSIPRLGTCTTELESYNNNQDIRWSVRTHRHPPEPASFPSLQQQWIPTPTPTAPSSTPTGPPNPSPKPSPPQPNNPLAHSPPTSPSTSLSTSSPAPSSTPPSCSSPTCVSPPYTNTANPWPSTRSTGRRSSRVWRSRCM